MSTYNWDPRKSIDVITPSDVFWQFCEQPRTDSARRKFESLLLNERLAINLTYKYAKSSPVLREEIEKFREMDKEQMEILVPSMQYRQKMYDDEISEVQMRMKTANDYELYCLRREIMTLKLFQEEDAWMYQDMFSFDAEQQQIRLKRDEERLEREIRSIREAFWSAMAELDTFLTPVTAQVLALRDEVKTLFDAGT